MKPYFFLGLSLFLLHCAQANTYYSINNSSPNLVTSWKINRNGTGSSPSSFSGTDIFIIQANHQLTTTVNWNINGNGAKIIIENGATLRADHKVTVDLFQINDGGRYVHNDNTTTIPGDNSRVFGANSTVEIKDWSGTGRLPESTTWGNLIIDLEDHNSNINQAGELTDIAGDLIIRSTGNSDKEFRLANSQDYTLTIGGDLVIEGGILEASSGNSNANQVIIINGSFRQSAGTFTRSNDDGALEIRFNGSNSHFTKTAGTLYNNYINWKVNGGKKLTLDNDVALPSARTFVVDGTLDCATYRLSGQGSFTLKSTGKIITSRSTGLSGNLNLSGTIVLTAGASYEFNAYTTTPFPTAIGAVSASSLAVNAGLKLNQNLTLTGSLSLTGNISVPPGYTFTVSTPNVFTGVVFGISKHIVTEVNTSTGAKGYLRMQNVSGTVTVPTGTGIYYLPAVLNVSGNNDFSLCTFTGITTNGQPNGTSLTTVQKKEVVDAVWLINRNSGTNDVHLQFSWPAALEGSTFSTVQNNRIGISHYGTYWEPAFGFGNQATNIATRTSVSNFSPFSVAIGSIPLPLQFGEMKVAQKNEAINVSWYSLSETNLSRYEIERSTDGRNFVTVGSVNAAGMSASRNDYSWNDSIFTEGIFFYRIKAVDNDLRYFYSSIARINITRKQEDYFTIYPNPLSGGQLNISGRFAPGDLDLVVIDQSGRLVWRKRLNHTGGLSNWQITLPSALKKGVYVITLIGSSETKSSRSLLIN